MVWKLSVVFESFRPAQGLHEGPVFDVSCSVTIDLIG